MPEPEGTKGRKVGHKGGTQPPLSPVPKTSLTFRRGNVFYFRRRIPTDLVRAKAYGDLGEIKESLRTSDEREAERLADREGGFDKMDSLTEEEKEDRAELSAVVDSCRPSAMCFFLSPELQ